MTIPSRYSTLVAGQEVRRVLDRIGRGSQKYVGLSIDLTESQMSAKCRGVTDRFTVEQLGQVANLLTGPAGWPWVPWDEPTLLPALPRLQQLVGGKA